MDVNSGSIHVADDVVYDMIPLVEKLAGEGVKDMDALKKAPVKNCSALIKVVEDYILSGVRKFQKL